jgi:hypothetical protein
MTTGSTKPTKELVKRRIVGFPTLLGGCEGDQMSLLMVGKT